MDKFETNIKKKEKNALLKMSLHLFEKDIKNTIMIYVEMITWYKDKI